MIIKQSVICVECGKLGDPFVGGRRRGDDDGSFGRANWWRQWLCEGCWEGGELGSWVRRRAWTGWSGRVMFVHERRWGRYEEGMRRGKEYRMEKGRRLRAEKGITAVGDGEREGNGNGDVSDGDVIVVDGGSGAKYCPIVGERRFCSCHANVEPKYGPCAANSNNSR